ncbi:MAG: cupredoxin domain-containing protein [bacterium]
MRSSFLIAWLFAAFLTLALGVWTQPIRAAQDVREVKYTASEFFFDPDKVKIDSGKVTFVVTNAGDYPHAFAIEGMEAKSTIPRIDPGETAKITVDLRKGAYVFYCPLEGHREQGMVGNFAVGVASKPAAKKKQTSTGGGDSGY